MEQNPAHTHANGRQAFKPLPTTLAPLPWRVGPKDDLRRSAGRDYTNDSGKIRGKPATGNPLKLDWRNLPGVEQNPPHTHANEKPTWEPIPVTVLPWNRSRWQDYDPAVARDYARYG